MNIKSCFISKTELSEESNKQVGLNLSVFLNTLGVMLWRRV